MCTFRPWKVVQSNKQNCSQRDQGGGQEKMLKAVSKWERAIRVNFRKPVKMG